MSNQRIAEVQDDWTVFAVSDVHGVVSGLLAALQQAGIVDRTGRWIAPARTALVGCGDYIDRGSDAVGLIRLLRRLEREAPAAGGVALFARGNHEVMALRALSGEPGAQALWLEYGGQQTLRSFDCDAGAAADPQQLRHAMEAMEPGVIDWLDGLSQAVRWRDTLFSHGGLAPGYSLDDLGVNTEDHLWVRAAFYATAWDSGAFDGYIGDGIERVVFGHTAQPHGPTLFHEGRSICIDTNAVGNPDMPPDAERLLTLIEPSSAPSVGAARRISIPTADAPERYRPI